jgi:hypothetical protein
VRNESAHSSRYEPDRPFDIDWSGPEPRQFHWEPEQATVDSLRVEGTCRLHSGHLVIDQLNWVGPSRWIADQIGERRRRAPGELGAGGIDSAAWKSVRIGRILGMLRAHYGGYAAFLNGLPQTTGSLWWQFVVSRELGGARARAVQRAKGRKPALTEAFLAEVSEEYLAEIAAQQHGAVKRLAVRYYCSPNTVKGWLARAKRDGLLVGGGPRGVAFAQPGPTLVAYRQKET